MSRASGAKSLWHIACSPIRVVLLVGVYLLVSVDGARAGPWLMPGDVWLKADVQLLADEGVITSPISSWPLSWGDIAQDLNAWVDLDVLSPSARLALTRMLQRADNELGTSEFAVDLGARLAEKPQFIRGQSDTPRGEQEIWVSSEWTGERFAARIKASYVNEDLGDSKSARLDGSYAAVALGNWMVGASLVDRWWGPGWNGSLILSSNARPIPSLVIERNFSEPFESRWLRWIGRWSTSVIWGELESNRGVPNARFFGWRVNFKPTKNLEVGLLRTAQWCGSGRECDLDAFAKLLIGDTNLDAVNTVDVANQLAGFDIRWNSPLGTGPYAVYGQFIGEDEAGGFPSLYMGQLGAEVWGYLSGRGTQWRSYLEYADTTCQFHESSKEFNCAYNNSFYPTGYRYRGRSIGYSTDNDSQSLTLGAVVNDVEYGLWSATVRSMRLNRDSFPDARNSITPVPVDLFDIDITHRREFEYGSIDFGVGAERRDSSSEGQTTDLRAYIGITLRL